MQQQIAQVLEHKGHQVHTTGPKQTVVDAVHAMNQRCIGALVVVEGQRIVGMLTERDILVRVVDARRDPSTTRVEEVMSRPVLTVGRDATVGETMRVMTKHRCRHLPVRDRDGRLTGLISMGDLTEWIARDLEVHVVELSSYIGGPFALASDVVHIAFSWDGEEGTEASHHND